VKRLTPRARQAIGLYASGPDGIRGDWAAACYAAGYQRPLPIKGVLATALAAEGVGVPADPPREVVLPDLPDASAPEAAWREMADKLLPTWKGVAEGRVDITTQQRAVLQDIMNRAYGRAGQGERGVSKLGVVLLPMVGSDATARVCPRCRQEYDL